MAYINVDEFKRKLIDEKNFFPAIVARALDEMPTVDVVPREEVEKIFEEIESVMYQKFHINHSVILIDKADYTELKKKYIGDKQRKDDGK
jgi:hypothetical protein